MQYVMASTFRAGGHSFSEKENALKEKVGGEGGGGGNSRVTLQPQKQKRGIKRPKQKK